jgi:predicted nuclease with TOPRIM domain
LKDGERRASEKFYERVKTDVEEIKKNSTVEGQAKLNEQREHPLSVFNRYKTFESTYNTLTEKMKEIQDKLSETKEKLKDYTKEELDEAEKTIREAFEVSTSSEGASSSSRVQ